MSSSTDEQNMDDVEIPEIELIIKVRVWTQERRWDAACNLLISIPIPLPVAHHKLPLPLLLLLWPRLLLLQAFPSSCPRSSLVNPAIHSRLPLPRVFVLPASHERRHRD